MSSPFLSQATAALEPYVPGEQPRDRQYIKLNTNENPYPPSPGVAAAIESFDSDSLRLYPDPDAALLNRVLAESKGLRTGQALACGGSDEALAFAFMAFFDRGDTVCFPDITYGFYRVYADLFDLHAKEIPLRSNFTIAVEDYLNAPGHIFLANPNAPTGICLGIDDIKAILHGNPNRLVVVDEAYIDFADIPSCTELVDEFDNLLVVQTFSKSRSLAGMRLGAAFGCAELIDGLNRIKYSFNPYNLDRVSIEVGLAALRDSEYTREMARKVVKTRRWTVGRLEALGFKVLPSGSNFVFCAHSRLPGRELQQRLKKDGILVRHFQKSRIEEYIRVTIGTDEQMLAFIDKVERYL